MLASCPRMLSPLSLNVADQQRLEEWVAAFGTPQQVALRSQIALAAAGGEADSEIAQQLGINRKTVMIWRARVADQGRTVCGISRRAEAASRSSGRIGSRRLWRRRS